MKAWLKSTILALLATLFAVSLLVRAAEIHSLSTADSANTARFPENLAPSLTTDGLRALEGILARWYFDTNCSTQSGGSSNAYTYTATRTISTLVTGTVVCFEANFANTNTASLNVSALGAAEITLPGGSTGLSAASIATAQSVLVVYDGSKFQMLSPVAAAGSSLLVANNLSDVASAATSRTNLGLLGAAQHATGTSSQNVPIIGTNSRLVTSIMPTGGTIQLFATSQTTLITLGTTFTYDDTIPQSNEGTLVSTMDMAVSNSANKIVFTISAWGSCGIADGLVAALFIDSTANALWSSVGSHAPTANIVSALHSTFIYTPGDTTAHTYKLRMGGTSTTCVLNGQLGLRRFGGVSGFNFSGMEVQQ